MLQTERPFRHEMRPRGSGCCVPADQAQLLVRHLCRCCGAGLVPASPEVGALVGVDALDQLIAHQFAVIPIAQRDEHQTGTDDDNNIICASTDGQTNFRPPGQLRGRHTGYQNEATDIHQLFDIPFQPHGRDAILRDRTDCFAWRSDPE